MEEFEEFDVLFSENPHHEKSKKKKTGLDSMKVYPAELLINNHSSSISREEEEEEEKNRRKKNKKMPITVPMRIPSLTSGNSILNRADEIFEQEETEETEEEEEEEGRKRLLFVPPHLMVEQRRTSKRMMAFSVCTGNGRTLKGRDLSRVRNSVLRMTGFIETC